jgi:hypothetical protein
MNQIALGLLVGLFVGAGMGYLEGRMAIWVGIGACTGMIIGVALDRYHESTAS